MGPLTQPRQTEIKHESDSRSMTAPERDKMIEAGDDVLEAV
jgi:hypothetical protein